MASIRRHITIDRTPKEVWQVVSDAGGLASWFPGIDSCSADGKLRRCRMGDVEVVEEIVTNDSNLRRFQYRFVEGAIMTADYHLATIDVLPCGNGSMVVYST